MEEAIWIIAPIACAVFAFLLDVRAHRRHEADQDAMREKIHGLHLAYIERFGTIDKCFAISDKVIEYIMGRIDTLEGNDSVPKSDGEKIEAQLENMRSNINGLALMNHNLTERLNELVAVPADAVEPEAKRGRKRG